ncbi:MAG: Peptidyl-tRNA hydrolase [Planctomycetota bacterium]|jgi:PTH1 family peptidyl-tRNA hydrolase
MKLVVGLGNPGQQYAETRHNIGFDVISELATRWNAPRPQLRFQAEIQESFQHTAKVLLVKPLTFMNLSGNSVVQLARYFQIDPQNVLVICDDLNLPLGKLRWRSSGSAGGQKGLADILRKLATEDVARLRLGIGRPPGQQDPADFVLQRFRSSERDSADLLRKKAADSIEYWLSHGIAATMNRYNTEPPQ